MKRKEKKEVTKQRDAILILSTNLDIVGKLVQQIIYLMYKWVYNNFLERSAWLTRSIVREFNILRYSDSRTIAWQN